MTPITVLTVSEKGRPKAKRLDRAGLMLTPENVVFVSPRYRNLDPPFFNNIQDAIDYATDLPNSANPTAYVWIHPGLYDERITMKSHVRLYMDQGAIIRPAGGGIGEETQIINFPAFCVDTAIMGCGIVDGGGELDFNAAITIACPVDIWRLQLKKVAPENGRAIAVIAGATGGKLIIDIDEIVGTTSIGKSIPNYPALNVELYADRMGDLSIEGPQVPTNGWTAYIKYYSEIGLGGNLYARGMQYTKIYFSKLKATEDEASPIYVANSAFVWLIDGEISSTNASYLPVRVMSNAELRLQHVKVYWTAMEGGASSGIYIANTDATVITDNCCIVGLGYVLYSVDGIVGSELKNWGSVANLEVNTTNVTELIQDVLVDPNVE